MSKLTLDELNKDVIVFFRRFAQPDVIVGLSTPLGKVKNGFWFEVPTLDQALDELAAQPFFPNSPRLVFTVAEEQKLLATKGATLGALIKMIAAKMQITA